MHINVRNPEWPMCFHCKKKVLRVAELLGNRYSNYEISMLYCEDCLREAIQSLVDARNAD